MSAVRVLAVAVVALWIIGMIPTFGALSDVAPKTLRERAAFAVVVVTWPLAVPTMLAFGLARRP